MEPAALYLIVVAGVGLVWLASDATWTAIEWARANDHVLARLISRTAFFTLAVVLVSSSVRLPSAHAEVVPPRHRVMDAGARPMVVAASAVTFASMVDASGPSASFYTVRSGDCLWSIARATLIEDGATPTGAMITVFWKRIYERNSHLIGANPRLIFPGQVLEIPER